MSGTSFGTGLFPVTQALLVGLLRRICRDNGVRGEPSLSFMQSSFAAQSVIAFAGCAPVDSLPICMFGSS